MKEYLRLLQYARPLRWVSTRYFLASVFHSIFGVINLTMLIPLLNLLFKNVDKEEMERVRADSPPEFELSLDFFIDYFYYYFGLILESEGELGALTFVCVGVIISVFLANVFTYLRTLQSEIIRARSSQNLRSHVFKKLSEMHVGYFSSQRKGDLLSRSTTDVSEVERSISNSFTLVLREPVLIVVYFVALFKISVELTVFTITVVPLLGAGVAIIVQRIKKKADSVQQYQGRLLSLLDEAIDGIRIVRAFNAIGHTQRKFDKENSAYSGFLRQYGNRVGLAPVTSEFLGVSIIVGTILYGGTLILGENTSGLTGATFITYIVVLSRLIQPLKALTKDWSAIQRGLSAGRRVLHLIDAHNDIQEKPNARPLKDFQEGIALENVSFAYEDEPVLDGISFELKKGDTIALVGPSGAGKSTIADLIPRFYDVTGGSIKIDGIDLRDYKLDSLLQHIGVVTQESVLFNDTIFNNIAFGKPDASREEVMEAAKIANAHEFIIATENGYDTIVGDRGMKLSGGQKQRISIARAIFKNPPILLLDEATSALDTESEKLVQNALEKLMANRTSLVIAHRLSTIQHATEIVVLERGKVVERGTHQQLLEQDGLYRKLNMMQTTFS